MQGSNSISAIARSPLLWGVAVTVAFFVVVHSGMLASLPGGEEFEKSVIRYTAGHPIEYVEVGIFFVGMAALAMHWLNVSAQRKLLDHAVFQTAKETGEPDGRADAGKSDADPRALLARLDSRSAAARSSYLDKRLRGALEHVQQQGHADGLDEQLKYLADVDASRQQAGYAFVRIIIWAIPIMGFLGTVVGITEAIANLSVTDLLASMPEVTSGLGVAFDTTALALVLSTILMFTQYFVEKSEGELLDGVEHKVQQELSGRFAPSAGTKDPTIAAVKRMCEAVLEAVNLSVRQQVELWQGTVDAAHERWSEMTSSAREELETALAGALGQSLTAYARQVASVTESLAAEGRRGQLEYSEALSSATSAIASQQQELSRQGDLLLKIVDSTGQVTRLEEALHRNLSALSGTHNFEATVESLAAAIHLLTARFGQLQGSSQPGSVRGEPRQLGQAA